MASTTRPRLVAITGSAGLPDGAIDRVSGLVDPIIVRDGEDLRRALPDAQIVFAWNFKAPALEEHWHLARGVRWIHVAAAGVDAVLFPSLRDSNVVLTNARGVFDVALSEYALALMLHFAKRLDRTLENQRARKWEYYLSALLDGSTVAVVGLGSIGRTFARRARALGMRVIGVRRGGAPDDSAEVVYPVSQLTQALEQADFVVIFTPRTAETIGLFGPNELAALKPGAILVNLGRGGVVDERALLDAVESGRIKVADDVFAQEPLPADSPLWSAPSFLLSPHLGGDDEGANERILDLWAENVRRYVSAEPLHSVVDKQAGY